jgi:hypothetical protein
LNDRALPDPYNIVQFLWNAVGKKPGYRYRQQQLGKESLPSVISFKHFH